MNIIRDIFDFSHISLFYLLFLHFYFLSASLYVCVNETNVSSFWRFFFTKLRKIIKINFMMLFFFYVRLLVSFANAFRILLMEWWNLCSVGGFNSLFLLILKYSDGEANVIWNVGKNNSFKSNGKFCIPSKHGYCSVTK